MTDQLQVRSEAGFDPAAEQKERAKLLIIHHAVQTLWEAGQPLRTADLTTLDGLHLFFGLVRQTLFQCEHLIPLGRRWELRWRQGAMTAPLGGLVTTVLTLKGRPMTAAEIADELASWRGQPIEVMTETIHAFLLSRLDRMTFAINDRFGLSDWLPQVEGLTIEEAKSNEFWGQETFADWLLTRAPAIDDAVAMATGLLNAVNFPLTHRELLFTLWAKSDGTLDILQALEQLLSAKQLQLLSLGYWLTEDVLTALRQSLTHQSDELRERTQQRAKHADIGRILQTSPSLKEPSVRLGREEADDIAVWLAEQPHPVPLERIIEQVLEVLPADPDYVPMVRALTALLRSDQRFAEFGNHCWWLADKAPVGVDEVPADLLPPPLPPLPSDLRGQFDLELPLEALDEDLRRLVEDPYYEEVGELEGRLPEEPKPPKRIELAVTYPHLRAGTLKIRRMDLPFFEPSPPLQFTLAIDDTHAEVALWINLSLGLGFGLGEWYGRRKVEVGGLVRLERSKSGKVQLRWTNRYDRLLHIPHPRLDELRQFAVHETVRKAPLIVLLQQMLTQYPQGVHFLRLWSELNILRRTTKRMLASLLCAYPMFARVPNMDGYWMLDLSKIGEGIREEKRPYLMTVGSP